LLQEKPIVDTVEVKIYVYMSNYKHRVAILNHPLRNSQKLDPVWDFDEWNFGLTSVNCFELNKIEDIFDYSVYIPNFVL